MYSSIDGYIHDSQITTHLEFAVRRCTKVAFLAGREYLDVAELACLVLIILLLFTFILLSAWTEKADALPCLWFLLWLYPLLVNRVDCIVTIGIIVILATDLVLDSTSWVDILVQLLNIGDIVSLTLSWIGWWRTVVIQVPIIDLILIESCKELLFSLNDLIETLKFALLLLDCFNFLIIFPYLLPPFLISQWLLFNLVLLNNSHLKYDVHLITVSVQMDRVSQVVDYAWRETLSPQVLL